MIRLIFSFILYVIAVCSALGQQPDLTSFILLSPVTNQPGDWVTMSIYVSNIGDAPSAAGYVDAFLNQGSPSYSPTNRDTHIFYAPIDAGGYVYIPALYRIPEGTPPGTYYRTSLADAMDTSTEVNENNNTHQTTLTIIPSTEPDLVIESITVDPNLAWHPSSITVELKNQGANVAAFSVGERLLHIQIDGQIGDVSTIEPLSLEGGTTYSATMDFTISSTGAYVLVADVDPDNVIAEAAELNNTTVQSNVWIASTIYDADGDGMVDADEVLAGSDPDDVDSVWKCVSESNGDGLLILWPSISNRWYDVERATDLSKGFTIVAENLPATPPVNSLLDAMTTNAFYRIHVR